MPTDRYWQRVDDRFANLDIPDNRHPIKRAVSNAIESVKTQATALLQANRGSTEPRTMDNAVDISLVQPQAQQQEEEQQKIEPSISVLQRHVALAILQGFALVMVLFSHSHPLSILFSFAVTAFCCWEMRRWNDG